MSESETDKAEIQRLRAERDEARKALERLRTRCHASTSGGGLQPFNVKAALAEILAALATAERQEP